MKLPKYILEALRLALLHCEECEALTYYEDGYEYVLKTAKAGYPWPVEIIVQARIRTPHGVLIRKLRKSWRYDRFFAGEKLL